MNSINIPRYYNGNLVYDEIPMNSIITTSTLTSGYSYINSNNDGILVKNNNDISFKKFNGILYYDNNLLKSYELTANTLIYVNNNKELQYVNLSGENNKILYVNNNSIETLKLESNHILYTNNNGELSQTEITEGVLNTYKFNDNTVSTETIPSFTNKIVLNNCELVENVENNQKITKNYLIYGKKDGGLSHIQLNNTSNDYEYYYIVNDKNNNVNVSTASQIYTNLYDKITKEGNSQELFSAIPICNSTDNQHLSLSLIIPQYYNNGNYYIKSDGSYFSLETIYGSILPSSLKIYTKDFNYSNNKILTIGKNNYNEDVFIPIQSSTSLKKPYLSGTGWGDLTYTTFLNSNNLNLTQLLTYSNPVVIGTDGSMYRVDLSENKKYVLTKSSFKELSITGNDLYINNYPSLNLHKIIQVDNDILSTLSDTTNTEIGLLHTKDTGEISISKLTNEDISDNAITGNKLLFNDLQTINNWSNIIIDTNGKLYNKHGDFFTNSNKFGVFNWQGDIQSLCANIITEGTMHGNRITQNTLKYDRLNISNDPQTSSWSIIAVNSNNNFITFSNTSLSEENIYGIFNYNGEIVKLDADKITSGTFDSNRIAQGAVGATQIANNSITSSKLNINGSQPSGSWKNLLINNNNFVKTNASVNNYGVFDNNGNVVELTTQLLNDIGLNLYTPDDDDDYFNQIFVSGDFIFYTSTINDITVNTNYIKVYNYFNSNKFNNNILYISNTNQFTDSYGNIENTYNAFYGIPDRQKYNIKFKTSLYIKDVQLDLRTYEDYYRYNNKTNEFIQISNDFYNSSPILIVGVYTSLCQINSGTQVIMLKDNIYKYTYDSELSNYCKSTLLGYLPINVYNLKTETNNIININKTFDFECTVAKEKIMYDIDSNMFDIIKSDLLFFVPMYYIINNNVEQLHYYDKTFGASKKHISDFYTNMFLDNKNILTLTSIKDNTIKLEISSNDFYIDNNDLKIDYNNKIIGCNQNYLYFKDSDSGEENIFMENIDNLLNNNFLTINSEYKIITFKYFINEPIEKNIKFTISPITKQSNIIYTIKDPAESLYELKNEIKYKFSLCSITASLTKNTGQYPAIIQ